MRDRLVELIVKALEAWDNYLDECARTEELPGKTLEAFVSDDLLANGVIVPPVKVGQTVWFVTDNPNRRKVLEVIVEKVVVKTGGVYMKLSCNAMYETSCRSIGKTVFLAREDAEKALKGGE